MKSVVVNDLNDFPLTLPYNFKLETETDYWNIIKRVKMKFSVAAAMLVATISATEAEVEAL